MYTAQLYITYIVYLVTMVTASQAQQNQPQLLHNISYPINFLCFDSKNLSNQVDNVIVFENGKDAIHFYEAECKHLTLECAHATQ